MAHSPSVALILPNYRGRTLLERFLPSVQAAARRVDARVVVVDDASPDESVTFLARHFPDVEVIRLERNGGFARAVNAGVAAVEAEIVVLLNTDVAPAPDFLPPLLRVLEESRVFAAVPRIRRPAQGGVAESAVAATFRRGLLRLDFQGDAPFAAGREPFPTLYPVLAAAALRRALFLELGGLDPLFYPYYFEDTDLGYRAWKAGYRTLCVPASEVEHFPGTISGTQPAAKVALAQSAHRFLFIWKNLHDRRWSAEHGALLGMHCLVSLLRGRPDFALSVAVALRRLPWALRARAAARRAACVSDREVLRQTSPEVAAHSASGLVAQQ